MKEHIASVMKYFEERYPFLEYKWHIENDQIDITARCGDLYHGFYINKEVAKKLGIISLIEDLTDKILFESAKEYSSYVKMET